MEVCSKGVVGMEIRGTLADLKTTGLSGSILASERERSSLTLLPARPQAVLLGETRRAQNVDAPDLRAL